MKGGAKVNGAIRCGVIWFTSIYRKEFVLYVWEFVIFHWKRIYSKIKYLKPHLTWKFVYILYYSSVFFNLLKTFHIFWNIEQFLRKANIIANSANVSKRSLDSIMPCWMVWIQFDSSKSFRLLSDWFIQVENEKEKHTDRSSFIELFVALFS